MENSDISDSNSNNSNKIKIPKTKKCVLKAVQKYKNNLKEKTQINTKNVYNIIESTIK